MAEIDVVLQRQWDLLEELTQTKDGLTLNEMADRFGVSEKTIKRDVRSLERVFGKLKTNNEAHGRKRYLYDRSPFSSGLNLDRNELLSLYVGQKLMTPLRGTFFWEGVKTGAEKIKKILRPETIKYADRVAPFFYRFEPTEQRYTLRLRNVIDEAFHAMEESRPLEIRYRSLRARRIKRYEIHPYNFVYWHNSVYLVGFCCRDAKFKIWKVDRLYDAKVVPNKRFRKMEFDVDRYLSNVVEPFVGDTPVVKATVLFTGYAARIVQEEKLKSVSKTHVVRNGVVVEMETEIGKTFIRWLLGFGSHAQVLAPESLRSKVLAEVNKIASLYEGVVEAEPEEEEEEFEFTDEEGEDVEFEEEPAETEDEGYVDAQYEYVDEDEIGEEDEDEEVEVEEEEEEEEPESDDEEDDEYEFEFDDDEEEEPNEEEEEVVEEEEEEDVAEEEEDDDEYEFEFDDEEPEEKAPVKKKPASKPAAKSASKSASKPAKRGRPKGSGQKRPKSPSIRYGDDDDVVVARTRKRSRMKRNKRR